MNPRQAKYATKATTEMEWAEVRKRLFRSISRAGGRKAFMEALPGPPRKAWATYLSNVLRGDIPPPPEMLKLAGLQMKRVSVYIYSEETPRP